MQKPETRNAMSNNVTRRDLLLTASVAALAARTTHAEQSESPSGGRWDLSADIVCVGAGAAGLTAAVTATDRGRKVIVLEKAPLPGGTTQKSGGVIWIPNNYILRSKGIVDSKDDCLRYLARFSSPQSYLPTSPTLGLDEPSYRLLEAFYDNAANMVDYIRKLGAVDFLEFAGANGEMLPDYADHLPENKVPRGRCLGPEQGNDEGGNNFIQQITKWLKNKEVPILTSHRVTRVVKNNNGRVVGVEAISNSKTIRVLARQAVIFGTGGFAHNAELIRTHQKFLYGACAKPTSTGDFIAIASAAGAKMGDLQTAWRSQVVIEEALANRVLPIGVVFVPGDSMIVVNKYGNRVVNEKRDYNDRTRAHFIYDPVHEEYPHQFLFMIFDERSLDAFAGNGPLPEDRRSVQYIIEGATLEDLTKKIQERMSKLASSIGQVELDPSFTPRLSGTISKFNEYAKVGKDPDFLRGAQEYDRVWHRFFSPRRKDSKFPENHLPNATMYPLARSGPYYAIILAAGALDTNGGPMISEHSQVLASDGTPIPSLYGAGNCIASPSKEAYFGAGGTIGLAMTFAYIAANHAANIEPVVAT
jgi:predicted oxidoreductase